MMKARPHDRHIYTPNVGHIEDVQCWCEPSRVYWVNELTRVIEHNDVPLTLLHPSDEQMLSGL